MVKIKKVLAFVLSLAIMFTTLSFSVFAASPDEIDPHVAVTQCPNCTNGNLRYLGEKTRTKIVACNANFPNCSYCTPPGNNHQTIEDFKQYECDTCGYKCKVNHVSNDKCIMSGILRQIFWHNECTCA